MDSNRMNFDLYPNNILRKMSIEELENLIPNAEKWIQIAEHNLLDSRVGSLLLGCEYDPWDRFEYDRAKNFIHSDRKHYFQAFAFKRKLIKLIEKKKRDYYWSARRFKSDN
jgi:hypothetical protein